MGGAIPLEEETFLSWSLDYLVLLIEVVVNPFDAFFECFVFALAVECLDLQFEIDVVKEQEHKCCYRNDTGEELSLDSELL